GIACATSEGDGTGAAGMSGARRGYRSVMPKYKVNDDAVSLARRLVDEGHVDAETGWGDAAPDATEGNEEIDKRGYDGYGRWHLGIDTEASEDTKDRYGFPYGDFQNVNRSAVIHAKQRASQNNHHDVAKAADDLLSRIDERSD
ncbi:MAG: hypothetical protein ACRDWE_00290, partial [Acidimicrobiales bacterium]